MAGSIRQVADWADKSQGNRHEPWDAIAMECGCRLILFGIELARWHVDEVRAPHEANVKIVGPLCKAAEQRFEGVQKTDRNELGGSMQICYC